MVQYLYDLNRDTHIHVLHGCNACTEKAEMGGLEG